MKSFTKHGMALVVVLTFSMVILILGTSYIQSFSNYKKNNPIHLERIQADFFAQGISKIALLKFKKFPADFYHAYLYDVASKKDPKNVPPKPAPTPLQVFHQESLNPVLQNNATLSSGIPISMYSTTYELTNTKAYNSDGLLITVTVKMNPTNEIPNGFQQSYQTLVEASRTRIL
ncbi:MAG: hypothetical protein HQM08_08190 [Candidatus Riflebacteria bacterium]|nr:hypothetical protein [Candidatus Riflebacteria bacterium]